MTHGWLWWDLQWTMREPVKLKIKNHFGHLGNLTEIVTVLIQNLRSVAKIFSAGNFEHELFWRFVGKKFNFWDLIKKSDMFHVYFWRIFRVTLKIPLNILCSKFLIEIQSALWCLMFRTFFRISNKIRFSWAQNSKNFKFCHTFQGAE